MCDECVDQAYRVLRACLEAAVTPGHLGWHPMDGVKRPKVDRKPMRFLTEDEVDRVADQVADRYRALVFVAAYEVSAWASFWRCGGGTSTRWPGRCG